MKRALFLLFLLILIGGTSFSQGSGLTLDFDGTSEAVDLGNSVANGCRTIEMWFKPSSNITSSNSVAKTLIGRDYLNGNGLSLNEFALVFYKTSWGNAGKLAFFRRDGSTQYVIYSDSDNWLANHWYHVAVTIGPTSGMKMYINGILQQSSNSSTAAIGTQSGTSYSDNVALAKWGSFSIRYFPGHIDEVRLWEDERTPLEIRMFMCKKLIGNEPSLRAYYRFDTSNPTSLNDDSPNSYHGTLVNLASSNWVYSGAPIGDISSFIYSATGMTGQSLSLGTSNNDQILVNSIVSSSKGLHLYKVISLPNSQINLVNPATSNYYGVFLTGTSGSFSLFYDYSFLGCLSCDKVQCRNDNSVMSWTNLTAPNPNCVFHLTGQSTVGQSFRGEFIIDTPVPSNVDLLGNDTTLCPGVNLVLDATYPGVLSYSWYDGSSNPTKTISLPGIYYVTVNHQSGCQIFDTIQVFYTSALTLSIGPDTAICDGDTVFLDATTNGAVGYLWQNNVVNPTQFVTSTGLYWVEITDANSCKYRDSMNISVALPLPLNLGSDTSLCLADSFLLDAYSINATSYLWSNGSTGSDLMISQSGVYWVRVENAMNCSVEDTIAITKYTPIVPDLGNDTALCYGISFNIDAYDTSFVSYLWQDGSTNSDFVTSTPGTFWVEISDSNYCVSRDSLDISFFYGPNFELGNDTLICLGDSLVLNISDPNYINYQWSDGSNLSSITLNQTGSYWVDVYDSIGCMGTDTIDISTLALPFVDFGPDTFLCEGTVMTLDASNPSSTYLWQDNSTQSTFLVDDQGSYSVIVTNSCGIVSSTIDIELLDCDCGLFTPNAFTPDGNGRNDEFGALSNCEFDEYILSIYDRWGAMIFHSEDALKKWDGTYEGENCPEGTYVYDLRFKFFNTEQLRKMSSITLLR